MNIETKFKEKTVTIEYTLDEKEVDILKMTEKIGYFEIRESRIYSEPKIQETLDLCTVLTDAGFLEPDFEAYHTTYVLTSLGKNFICSI